MTGSVYCSDPHEDEERSAMTDTFTCPRRAESFVRPAASDPTEDRWHADRSCSYCGSIQPEYFFELVAAGGVVGPTDKAYKAYVQGGGLAWGKVYFQHFSDADCRRFIDLVNAHEMSIGSPGYFYARPFFIAPPAEAVS